jgi:hypothetical protein
MLSNHIVGNYKLVLFIDNIGIERSSGKLLEKLLDEQNLKYETFTEQLELTSETAVFLPPISKLELNYDEASIAETIQGLKLNRNVTQIFGWATSKNINSRLLIPFLESMSDVIVTIRSDKLLSILTKRKFGSVKLKEYQHELTCGRTSIKEYKLEKQKVVQEVETSPESIGTFKIGEFSSMELEAKQKQKLPFEIM